MVEQSLKKAVAFIQPSEAYQLLDEPPGLTFKNCTFASSQNLMRSRYDINVAHLFHCIIIFMIYLSCLLQVQKLCHIARTLASTACLLWN